MKKEKHKPDPRFDTLPEALKDPRTFKKTEKLIALAGETGHGHKHIITWNRCKHCQQKFLEKRAKIKKLGFADYEQYLAWKRIMLMMLDVKKLQKQNENKAD